MQFAGEVPKSKLYLTLVVRSLDAYTLFQNGRHLDILLLLGCQYGNPSRKVGGVCSFYYWVAKPSRNLRCISSFYFFPCREKSCLSLPCLVVSLCIVSSVRIL